MNQIAERIAELDRKYSQRYIELDPGGYFIIYLDREAEVIYAKHFTNTISEKGLALDPETGKPIPVRGKVERTASVVFSGRTAKELCIKLFEEMKPPLVNYLDHAAYLGRELVRAEVALISGEEYVQD